jgi:F-type H+-transporting ATPase subunit b
MEGLGINAGQIVFYLVSFLLAMIILDRFVFRKVAKILTEREQSIGNALKERDEINQTLQKIEEQKEAVIQQAKAEARTIYEKAVEAVDPQKEQILHQAQLEADKIIVQAQKQAEEIVQNAKAQAQSEVVTIFKQIVKKAFENLEIKPEVRDQVMEQLIHKV